jgi:hypothetical protein
VTIGQMQGAAGKKVLTLMRLGSLKHGERWLWQTEPFPGAEEFASCSHRTKNRGSETILLWITYAAMGREVIHATPCILSHTILYIPSVILYRKYTGVCDNDFTAPWPGSPRRTARRR